MSNWQQVTGSIWKYDIDRPSGRIWYGLEAMRWHEKNGHTLDYLASAEFNSDGTIRACFGACARLHYEGRYINEGLPGSTLMPFTPYSDGIEDALEEAEDGEIDQTFKAMGLPMGKGAAFTCDLPPGDEAYYSPEHRKALASLARRLDAAGW